MEVEEMIRILEEIIRDPDANPTARCTAIRVHHGFAEWSHPRRHSRGRFATRCGFAGATWASSTRRRDARPSTTRRLAAGAP
jgi:hypothetical protein